jgi:hypothetical protein
MFDAIKKSKILVLTGAGASVALGRDTTKQFLKRFSTEAHRRLAERGGALVSQLSFVHEAATGGKLDIEHVLSLLEERRDAARSLIDDGAFKAQVAEDVQSIVRGYAEANDTIARAIYDMVIEHYSAVDEQQAGELYRELLRGFPAWFGDVPDLGLTLPFFTLNYDTAIESAVASWLDEPDGGGGHMEVRLVNGLTQVRGGTEPRWSEREFASYREVPNKANIVLVKLHGSVLWGRRGGVRQPYVAQLPIGVRRDPGEDFRHAVLYPTLAPKPVADEPFRTGYRCLRACLHTAQLLVIIGSSLRDPEIVAELRDAMEANERLHIVAIDPNLDHNTVATRVTAPPARVAAIGVAFEAAMVVGLMGRLRDFARLASGVETRASVRFGKTFDASILDADTRVVPRVPLPPGES